MNIPDKLKLNRFRLVVLPSTRDLYARFGQRVMPPSSYTGDDPVESVTNKVEALARANGELYERMSADPQFQEE